MVYYGRMSRSSAAVRFPDGTIYTTLYDGSSGYLLQTFLPTSDLRAPWGEDSLYGLFMAGKLPDIQCTCDHVESVDIATNYGHGIRWSGTACRKCMVVIGPRDPFSALMGLEEYRQAGPFGIPSPEDQGDPMPRDLVNFGGYEDGLPSWWPADVNRP